MSTQTQEYLPNLSPAEGAQFLQEQFTSFLGGTALERDMSDPWALSHIYSLQTADEVTGNFTQNDLKIGYGSLPEGHITVNVNSPTGRKSIELQLRNNEPTFRVAPAPPRPVIEVEPIGEDYIYKDTPDAFHWEQIVRDGLRAAGLPEGHPLTLVVFRSHLKEDADRAELHYQDDQARKAAEESPALLHYFAGEVDGDNHALSFCLWSDATAAWELSKEDVHKRAVQQTYNYHTYRLEAYTLRLTPEGVTFTPIKRSKH